MSGHSRTFQVLMVAIIFSFGWALYAGIAMPSFRKGQQSACVANIHQLSLAIRMYAEDYDSTLPPYPATVECTWPKVLRHYALEKKTKKFDPSLVDVSSVKPFVCPARAERGYGFGFNWYVAGQLSDPPGDPTELILLAESSESTDEEWWVNDSEQTSDRWYWQPTKLHSPQLSIHPGGGCIAFFDGHVLVMKASGLSVKNWLSY